MSRLKKLNSLEDYEEELNIPVGEYITKLEKADKEFERICDELILKLKDVLKSAENNRTPFHYDLSDIITRIRSTQENADKEICDIINILED